MTKETAIKIKEEILDNIKDYIPDALVDPLWAAYVEEFNPSDRHAPCTCNGKLWSSMLASLRERVTETINAQVYVVENQVVTKKETLEELQAKAKQRHSKKK